MPSAPSFWYALACATASRVEVEATPATCSFDRRLHHRQTLGVVEISKLTGRAKRRQPVHAGGDKVLAQARQHVTANGAVGIERRNKIRKDTMEIRHGKTCRRCAKPRQSR